MTSKMSTRYIRDLSKRWESQYCATSSGSSIHTWCSWLPILITNMSKEMRFGIQRRKKIQKGKRTPRLWSYSYLRPPLCVSAARRHGPTAISSHIRSILCYQNRMTSTGTWPKIPYTTWHSWGANLFTTGTLSDGICQKEKVIEYASQGIWIVGNSGFVWKRYVCKGV
jgi:hypothetical protein